MSVDDWLSDTRTSYDTVAVSYARLVDDLLTQTPYERAALAAFADLVQDVGGGPVADVGCGTGRITAHLHTLNVDAFGIDLSPGMIAVARRHHPELRFEIGSMTALDLPDNSLTGLIAWYSLIHVPDDQLGAVFAHFRRVVRPGGPLLLGFHVGDETTLKTEGYGGYPMKVNVHRRQPAQMAAWLRTGGFRVESQTTLTSPESKLGAIIFGRREP